MEAEETGSNVDPTACGDGASARRRVGWALVAILVIALGLRVAGCFGSGYPFSFYPDERNNVERTVFLSIDLNPKWFNKPTFGYYVNYFEFGCYYLWGHFVTGEFASVDEFELKFIDERSRGPFYAIARSSNCLFAMLTVWLVYRLGRRIGFTRAESLAGATALALTAGHVAWSQVVKQDVLGAFFFLAALGWLVKIPSKGRARDYAWGGLLAGLGGATKYTPVVAVVPLLVAHFALRPRAAGEARTRGARLVGLALIALLAGFFIGSPYNFLDSTYAREVLRPQVSHLVKMLGFGSGEVNPDETSVISQIVAFWTCALQRDVIGPALVVLSFVGLYRIARVAGTRVRRGAAIVLIALVAAMLVLTVANTQRPRPNHLVMIQPLLACFAGYGWVAVLLLLRTRFGLRWLPDPGRTPVRAVIPFALLLALPVPGLPGHALVQRYREVYTHPAELRAFDWIQANVPAGTTVLDVGDQAKLFPTAERLDWLVERTGMQVERVAKRMAILNASPGQLDEPGRKRVLHLEGVENRFRRYARQYELLRAAGSRYEARRYDVIILLTPWQTEVREKIESSASGYNDLWPREVFEFPEPRPTIENYRHRGGWRAVQSFVKGAARLLYPLFEDHPVDFVISRAETHFNYSRWYNVHADRKRTEFPEWAAFFDDLIHHYDCWEFVGDAKRTLRVWDVRTRITDRTPAVRVVESP